MKLKKVQFLFKLFKRGVEVFSFMIIFETVAELCCWCFYYCVHHINIHGCGLNNRNTSLYNIKQLYVELTQESLLKVHLVAATRSLVAMEMINF